MESPEDTNIAPISALTVVKLISLSLILIVSLAGNMLVCYCGMKTPRMSAMNRLIVNLAVAEIFVVFLVVPLKMEKEIIGKILVSSISCKLLEFGQSVTVGTLMMTMTMIGVDRFYSTFYPLHKITRRQARYMIVFSWCYSLIFANPILYHVLGAKQQPEAILFQCEEDISLTWHDKLYSLTQLWAIFLLPVVTMTAIYFIVVNKLLRSDNKRVSVTKLGADESAAGSGLNCVLRSNIIPLAKRKAIVMNLIVMTAFLLCWAPMAALYAVEIVTTAKMRGDLESFRDIAVFLALGKLCVNPVVYSFFDSSIHAQLCRCRGKLSSPNLKILQAEKCTGGKLSQFSVSKLGRVSDGTGESHVYREPLLKVASATEPASRVSKFNPEKLARLVCNTRRYRSLGLGAVRSSNI